MKNKNKLIGAIVFQLLGILLVSQFIQTITTHSYKIEREAGFIEGGQNLYDSVVESGGAIPNSVTRPIYPKHLINIEEDIARYSYLYPSFLCFAISIILIMIIMKNSSLSSKSFNSAHEDRNLS